MSTGFLVGSTDLDDIFDPYQGGTKPATTGFLVGSQDLRDRYNPRAEGDAAPATGMRVGSADLNSLFAAKGTSSKALVIPFLDYEVGANGNDDSHAMLKLILRDDGTWYVAYTVTPAVGIVNLGPLSGAWHAAPAAGVGADYEVRMTYTATQSMPGIGGSKSHTNIAGWRSLSSDKWAQVDLYASTMGGGVPSSSWSEQGYFDIDIRRSGASSYKRSTWPIKLMASAD